MCTFSAYAESTAVETITPETKTMDNVVTVSGRVEARQDIVLPAEVGGTVENIPVSTGQKVNKGQLLLEFETDELEKQLEQARAGEESAEANLEMTEAGAREEEIEAAEASYRQAEASLEGAKKNLELMEAMVADKVELEQQLVNAESQVENAEKQLEIAEENLKQAENSLENAEKEYERAKNLREKEVLTEKEFEGIELQYKNAESNLETARLSKEQAADSLESSKKAYELAEESYENPYSLQQQLENARNQVDVSRANLESAEANLKMTRNGAREEEIRAARANLKQAETSRELAEINLDKAQVTAPSDGEVAEIYIDEGEVAGSGTQLIRLINASSVYIEADVSPRVVNSLSPETEVEVDILPLNQTRTGVVQELSPAYDSASGGYPVKVLLENEDKTLKSGMNAELSIRLDSSADTLVVPVDAVLDLDGEPYVYVVSNDKAERRKIKTGIQKQDEVEVIEGITGEDRVVIRGQNSLEDGETVEVVE
ncbi:MAG: efflux RND transporter periplasmic adaptor subunit [Halanaerobiaceae bacterium]